MLILLPIFIFLLAAIILLVLYFTRPNFRQYQRIAASSALLAFLSVFLIQINLPQTVNLPQLQFQIIISYSPSWLADGLSWPYILSIVTLVAGIVLTSVIRTDNKPLLYAGTFFIAAFGILAVTANNALTVILVWVAFDITELITLLRLAEAKNQHENAIISFALRISGIGMILWASLLSRASGSLNDFQNIPSNTWLFYLIAISLRLGIFPLRFSAKGSAQYRNFGTTLRLMSAASSLALLARISLPALETLQTMLLLIIVELIALYSSWSWLRASDDLAGRPFWIVGLASLAVACSLRANPIGSVAWGMALIFSGGFLSMYSIRQRNLSWLWIMVLWGLTSLPFSPTASGWLSGNNISQLLVIPYLPAQAFLIAGFIRHARSMNEGSPESPEPREWISYTIGLFILGITYFLIGLWGWDGARNIGVWWAALVSLLLAITCISMLKKIDTFTLLKEQPNRWIDVFQLRWLSRALHSVYRFFSRVSDIATATLEGDGGVLWSFLLLVLILSIISSISY